VALLQVCRDGGRTGLVPTAVELFAQRHDLVLDRSWRAGGAVVRAS
jgi:hypothetical protein